MLTMKKLKLNQLSKAELENREMSAIKGGNCCGCGCHYEGQPGGSSTTSNRDANYKYGYDSVGGNIDCRCGDVQTATA
ncbi:rSAM-modified peptide [Bacteroidales bacterium M08MB]|nr:rSAM-modified peptide [Perlabentimonas gracilis]